jgi:hypothetical protein
MLKGIGGSQLQILKPDNGSRVAPLLMGGNRSLSSGKLQAGGGGTQAPLRGEGSGAVVAGSPGKPMRSTSSGGAASSSATAPSSAAPFSGAAEDEGIALAVELNLKVA